jgi:hypothetical protein
MQKKETVEEENKKLRMCVQHKETQRVLSRNACSPVGLLTKRNNG